MRIEPVFLFDLGGALINGVHQHVLAWRKALDEVEINLSVWRIDRSSRDNPPKSGAQRSSRIAVSSAPICPPWLASTDAISER
jgi:hypothetical protein